MPLIQHAAYLIQRNTSQLVVAPLYEKPLLQLKFNANQADRSLWVKTLDKFPVGVPEAGKAKELECEAEMQRLAMTYGSDMFRKVYPLDQLFETAFAACGIAALPGQEHAVPDLEKNAPAIVEEFLDLNVPTLDKAKAQKFADAGYNCLSILKKDVLEIGATTGLPHNLIRSTIEAIKKGMTAAPPPRRAPSAPSELRATVEALGS